MASSNLSTFFETLRRRSEVSDSQDTAKKAAADAVLDQVESGMTLGLGTGSTVDYFLQGLAERVRQGLDISGVPTSEATERRASELGIPLLGGPEFPLLANQLCVDGADRVDQKGHLIKGGGGALFREKLVATHSEKVCILIDLSKVRSIFDDSFAVPVECLPFGLESIMAQIRKLDCTVSLRKSNDGSSVVTDNGNNIVDCLFSEIPDPESLNSRLSSVTGVVEVGLFCGLLDSLVVGFGDGTFLTYDMN